MGLFDGDHKMSLVEHGPAPVERVPGGIPPKPRGPVPSGLLDQAVEAAVEVHAEKLWKRQHPKFGPCRKNTGSWARFRAMAREDLEAVAPVLFAAGVEEGRAQVEARIKSDLAAVENTSDYPVNDYLRGMHTGFRSALALCEGGLSSAGATTNSGMTSNEGEGENK